MGWVLNYHVECVYWRLCKLALARVKSSVDDRLQKKIMSMAQKTPLLNITDFMTSSSRADRECTEERDGPSPPNRSKHRKTFDPSWVRYDVAPDQENRPSMLCTLGHESSKRMVWLTIPCKLLRKDKLLEHQRSWCKQT